MIFIKMEIGDMGSDQPTSIFQDIQIILNATISNFNMDETELTRMMEEKFKIVYSERLGKNVHVIKTWVEEPVFKRHKKLFGYTDIGWTVRHPQDLIKALVEEGVWFLENK